MTHASKVSDDTFRLIKAGRRIIEPRVYDTAHRQIKIGDMLLFINRTTQEEVLAKVVGLLRYSSFKELFNANPLSRFGVGDEKDLLKSMGMFYTHEHEMEHGVVGIKVHILQK